MPRDNIFNESDGQQIAWIDSGNVFSAATKKQVGVIRDGNLYTIEGQLVGHLECVDQVRKSGNKTPDAFMRLLKAS